VTIVTMSPRLLLACAAATTAAAAVVADVGLGEHPTHSVVLGLVAVAVWALNRRFMRNALALTTLPVVSAALTTQPALHLTSKIGRPPAGSHDHANLLHILASEAPVAGMQVVVPAVVLVAVALGAHLVHLLIDAVRRPLVAASEPFEVPDRAPAPVRVRRCGSMLHWCGWAIRAARRGPPLAGGHVLP